MLWICIEHDDDDDRVVCLIFIYWPLMIYTFLSSYIFLTHKPQRCTFASQRLLLSSIYIYTYTSGHESCALIYIYICTGQKISHRVRRNKEALERPSRKREDIPWNGALQQPGASLCALMRDEEWRIPRWWCCAAPAGGWCITPRTKKTGASMGPRSHPRERGCGGGGGGGEMRSYKVRARFLFLSGSSRYFDNVRDWILWEWNYDILYLFAEAITNHLD